MFTIHATINEINNRFGWNYVASERCQRKLQKREINANNHPSTQQQGLIFVYNELFFIT